MSAVVVPLLRAGLAEQAAAAVAEMLAADPAKPEHLRARGVVCAWRHDWEEARSAFESALRFQAADAAWWRDVGVALIGAGAAEQAGETLERALALAEEAATCIYYAEALEALGRFEEAAKSFARGTELDPTAAAGFEGLMRVYARIGFDSRAVECARRAARLRRFDAHSLHMLADAQFQSANLQNSLRTYRRAMRREPSSAGIHSGYLFASVHDPRLSAAALRELHEDWFRAHCVTATPRSVFPNEPSPHRRLRIGYVSVEFLTSPTQYFLLPLLQAHRREEFEVYCYHTSRKSDKITEQYKDAAEHWRDAGTSKALADLAATIAEDRIDILIDTSGHFAPKVLPLFARRAAPVQAALPIYPSTTGCREIDFLISDRWTTPDERFEKQYSEGGVRRIETGYVVYAAPADAPAVSALPANKNGYCTFGLFQRPAKFNDHLWSAIGRILMETPGSHLLVHHGTLDLEDPASELRRSLIRLLADQGVAHERIEFQGKQDLQAHLQTVARADIALDTFPYSGHTTTGDALWMGVPVVTLAGETHASRVSAGLLERAGLREWIAGSHDDYVRLAVAGAADQAALAQQRLSLRGRVAESSICQPRVVVRQLEECYRRMWRAWCEGQLSSRPNV